MATSFFDQVCILGPCIYCYRLRYCCLVCTWRLLSMLGNIHKDWRLVMPESCDDMYGCGLDWILLFLDLGGISIRRQPGWEFLMNLPRDTGSWTFCCFRVCCQLVPYVYAASNMELPFFLVQFCYVGNYNVLWYWSVSSCNRVYRDFKHNLNSTEVNNYQGYNR